MRRLTHLIILAALAVSAPAWGNVVCPDGSWAQSYDTCTGKGAMRAGEVQAATPDELKAAAEIIAPKVAHALLSADVLSCEPEGRCNVFVGLRAGAGAPAKPNGDLLVSENTIVGACAGVTPFTGNRNIAIGDHTRFPPNASGFVNIGNHLCFWRDTGERAACPAPEPECGKGKSDGR